MTPTLPLPPNPITTEAELDSLAKEIGDHLQVSCALAINVDSARYSFIYQKG